VKAGADRKTVRSDLLRKLRLRWNRRSCKFTRDACFLMNDVRADFLFLTHQRMFNRNFICASLDRRLIHKNVAEKRLRAFYVCCACSLTFSCPLSICWAKTGVEDSCFVALEMTEVTFWLGEGERGLSSSLKCCASMVKELFWGCEGFKDVSKAFRRVSNAVGGHLT
jgi:hypothetical protein